MKRAQILEKVKKIPVNVTICKILFRVNVGYCGGEFAISSYTHNDIETLRDSITPSALQCNAADPDGYLPINFNSRLIYISSKYSGVKYCFKLIIVTE